MCDIGKNKWGRSVSALNKIIKERYYDYAKGFGNSEKK